MIETFVPAIVDSFVSFPFLALKLDSQASQASSLAPKKLYHGVGTVMLGIIPTTSILLATNEIINGEREHPWYEDMLIGGAAGTTSAVVGGAFDLITTQQRHRKEGFSTVVGNIFLKNGLRGFTQGMPPALIRGGLAGAGFFGIPPMLQNLLGQGEEEIHPLSVTAGGVLTAILTQPIDVTQSAIQRMQLQQGERPPKTFEVMKKIYQNQGVAGLWKGVGFRSMYLASSFTLVSMAAGFLKDHHRQENEQVRHQLPQTKTMSRFHHLAYALNEKSRIPLWKRIQKGEWQ